MKRLSIIDSMNLANRTYPPRLKQALRIASLAGVAALSLGSTGAQATPSVPFVAVAGSLQAPPPSVSAPAPIVDRQVVQADVSQVAAPVQQTTTVRRAASSGGGCTLDVIKQRESGGSYSAQNPSSTASGAYQVLDGTWGGYGGFRHAKDAPSSVQDQFAQKLYAAHGSRPWVTC